ncbi:hypothetical protein MNBD_GAMMA09-3782 [hydrothermal vent metagenome]|uniref:SPOR domain-containing protein n=1 Tax=hydrothermal vent metagenome TaxID=652676 RepID=A0A3B0XHH8_9ZZZZ
MASKNNSSAASSTDLSEQSVKFLNLSKQPFAREILSDKSFFKSQALDKISDSLLHQVQFSELLLVVEGPHGSGKTALFRQFIQTDISNTKTLSMQAEATDTLVQIQQKMSIHLQDMGDDNHLDDNLKSLKMFDQTPLVVMDNAHVLSDTTLQDILRYQQELKQAHEITLKLLIFANSGIADTLLKITDIQPEQMYVQQMPEYSAKQIELFISHKLFCAGYAGDNLLDIGSIQQLLKKSQGIPLAILQLTAPLIDKAITKKIKPAGKRSKKLSFISFALIVLTGGGLAAYYLLVENTPNPSDNYPVATDMTEAHSTDLASREAEPAADLDNINHDMTADAEPDVIDILEYDEPENDRYGNDRSGNIKHGKGKPESDAATQLETTSSIPEYRAEQPTQAIEMNNNEAVHNTEIKNPVETTHVTDNAIVHKPVADTVSVANEAAANKPIIEVPEVQHAPVKSEPAAAHRSAQKKTATPRTPPAPHRETISEPAKTAQPAQKTPPLHPALKQLQIAGVHNEDWLKQQPKSNWTLQFLGARGPETLLKFTRKHNLSAPVTWYKTRLKGKDYFVLVYGSYPDRNTARNAIKELSPQLQAVKPWVKSMKSVQQALK